MNNNNSKPLIKKIKNEEKKSILNGEISQKNRQIKY